MKTVNYDKDIKELFVILICLVIMLGYVSFIKFTYKSESNESNNDNNTSVSAGSFSESFVKTVASDSDGNYLVSPYSVSVALSMLSKGAKGNTLEEINKVLGNYSYNDISSEERIGVVNALFAKDLYKNYVIRDFTTSLTNDYGSEIIYDKFENPDKINAWCRENTWNMIDKVVDDIDPDFSFGIANAVAIDVEWESAFNCSDTSSVDFTKLDNSKVSVEMMHNSYSSSVSYFEDDSAKGVIIPYKKYDKEGNESEGGNNLEFVGILPNNSVNDYLNGLKVDGLSSVGSDAVVATDSKKINLSLPRFKYDYDLSTFESVLQKMGINDAFNPDSADFTGILSKDDMVSLGVGNLYVNSAIHKTHIDLNEKGTRAAAITFFGIKANGVAEESDSYNISFDKTFIYMIRDNNTKEIVFFGVVDSPNVWSGSTCNDKK